MSSRTEATRHSGALPLAAIVLVAVALRVPGLDTGLWFDEIVTLVKSARLPLWQILTHFPGVNAHPLYSVFAHLSLQTFGDSAWTLRLPAVVFGVLSVALVYLLAIQWMSRLEALVASAVLATSYHHIWFSQNARGYTLIGFVTLVATYALLQAGSTGRRRDYVLYAVACAAGVYAHLTMAFVVAGHAAVLLVGHAIGWRPAVEQPLKPALGAWIGAGLVAAALYAPYVPGLLAELQSAEPEQAAQVATMGWAVSEAVRQVLLGAGVPAAILGGLFALVGAVALWRRHRLPMALLLAPAFVTCLGIVLLGHPLRPRFFFFLSGVAAILVGRGVGVAADALAPRGRLARTPAVLVLAGVLILLSAIALPRNYRVPKQDFDGAMQVLSREEAGGARIATTYPTCVPFELFYRKDWACLRTADDWRTVTASGRVVLAATLTDYIPDAALAAHVRADCRPIARFEGTLSGGDILVCEATE